MAYWQREPDRLNDDLWVYHGVGRGVFAVIQKERGRFAVYFLRATGVYSRSGNFRVTSRKRLTSKKTYAEAKSSAERYVWKYMGTHYPEG